MLTRADYHAYIASEAWQAKRKEFFAKSQRVLNMKRKYGRIVCEFCKKAGKFNLHHRTYKRLGCERTTDLVILCDDCHSAVHKCDAPTLRSATRRTRKAVIAHILRG